MDFKALNKFLTDKNQPKFRFSQIASDIVSGRPQSYLDIFTIPQQLRSELEQNLPLISVKEKNILISEDKKSYKALLELKDGNTIETVLLNPMPALWSVCLSTQVGCGMGCAFCATGQMGLKRNLSTEEITDQILFWKQYIAKNRLNIRISNIVYMGMGEPFINKEAVFESIEIFSSSSLYNIGNRKLSVSTCGITQVIEEFATRFPQVNLAISLHAPNQELREKIMPVAKIYPLENLMKQLKKYIQKTNRQLFIEYILLSNENDTDKHAIQLGNLISDYFTDKLHLIHINLIVYNPTNSNLQPTSKEQVQKFKRILENFKIGTTVRKNLGQEIKGACGQLASNKN
jgi:23S rRNA (adenine(2503)-C(2))-methyltransferase